MSEVKESAGATPAAVKTAPARKAPKRMRAYVGRIEKSPDAPSCGVFTVLKTCGVGEKSIREAAEALGPGKYHVLTGRASAVEVTEEKKCVAKITM
jgi:hypothetical protein